MASAPILTDPPATDTGPWERAGQLRTGDLVIRLDYARPSQEWRLVAQRDDTPAFEIKPWDTIFPPTGTMSLHDHDRAYAAQMLHVALMRHGFGQYAHNAPDLLPN